MKKGLTLLIVGLVVCAAGASAESETETEVAQAVLEGYAYLNENLKGEPGRYSENGALEFWSNGGLLQEIDPKGRTEEFEAVNLRAKHIRVITLVEGQAAVAHFYSEGSMQPMGYPAVSHYLTRVTQIYVKEDGEWKIRSSHWSPVTGGAGTSQPAQQQ